MKQFIAISFVAGAIVSAPMIASAQTQTKTQTQAQTQAADTEMITMTAEMTPKGTFTKKRYNVKGEWEIVTINGKAAIQFSDDFKTKNGPDLKVFLSPKSVTDLTGKTALEGAVSVGVLKSNKGGQTYLLPDNVSLAEFSSVIVHCEAYSVLWGGFDIPK